MLTFIGRINVHQTQSLMMAFICKISNIYNDLNFRRFGLKVSIMGSLGLGNFDHHVAQKKSSKSVQIFLYTKPSVFNVDSLMPMRLSQNWPLGSVTSVELINKTTGRMWADAQRDGRPAKYRCHPLRCSVIPLLVLGRKVWLTPAAGVSCSNAANIGEGKTWTQSEFCTWQNSVSWQEPPKM